MTENKPREMAPCAPNIITTPEDYSMARILRALLVGSLWVVAIPWLVFRDGTHTVDRTDILHGHAFMVMLGLAIFTGWGVVGGILYYLMGAVITGFFYFYPRTEGG